MPLAEITLIEGRSADTRRALMSEVAEVVARVTDVPLASVRVILREVPGHHWSVGGIPKDEFPIE